MSLWRVSIPPLYHQGSKTGVLAVKRLYVKNCWRYYDLSYGQLAFTQRHGCVVVFGSSLFTFCGTNAVVVRIFGTKQQQFLNKYIKG